MTTTVDISQRTIALNRANEVRSAQAKAYRKLSGMPDRATSMGLAADMLESRRWESMSTERLLRACRGIARQKAARIMLRADIRYGGRRLRDLTERQRAALCEVLRAG